MKKIINTIFSIVAGLSVFLLMTCLITNWVDNTSVFMNAILKDFLISQLFILIITAIVLSITNLQDIANWLKDNK